jgi:hypothetical protein
MNQRNGITDPTSFVGAAMLATALAGPACTGGAAAPDTGAHVGGALSYPIVDTLQTACYDNEGEIACPAAGEPFSGQDAQSFDAEASYAPSADGLTVHDEITGLTWQQGYEALPQYGSEANAICADLDAARYGGFAGWRLPTIKELYSLWKGSPGWPYVDTTTFAHPTVDSHSIFWSSNEYVGVLESTDDPAAGAKMTFGVNFDTGHIKAYTAETGPRHLTRCVRGETYGVNDLVDHGDGTVTDLATGLMWSQDDSASGMDWEHALAFAHSQSDANYLGHADWRLPNAKELQSLVDYTRSPGATDASQVGPAIDARFNSTPIVNEAGDDDYPWYWTSTSAKANEGAPYISSWYVAFGRAVGSDGMDLHGAGAVRFDTKVVGEPGGESRSLNYVRLVRDLD